MTRMNPTFSFFGLAITILISFTVLISCEIDDKYADEMTMDVLLTNLEYPKALFVKNNFLYFTETAARNTTFGGKLALNLFNLSTNDKIILKENPENSDALVVIGDNIYLSSYHVSIPGENGKVSIFNMSSYTETHFKDIEIATNDMCTDANNNFYILGSSDKSDAKSLYKFKASDYSDPEVLLTGLGRTRSIDYSDGYFYYSDLSSIHKYDGINDPSIFVGKGGVTGISLSETYLYYSANSSGKIGRINLFTSEDEILYDSINRPASIFFDRNKNALFVLTYGTTENQFKDGELLRINNAEQRDK